MTERKLWLRNKHEDDDRSGGSGTLVIIMWVAVSLIGLVLLLILLQCWKRHRLIKRAQLARQDAVLNMPVATPWEVSGVPYAEVVDVAATAPDHDELLPATEPEYSTRR